MTDKEFKNLEIGDLIKPKGNPHNFIVTANYGDRKTAVRTMDMTNPREYDLIFKSNHKKPDYKDIFEEISKTLYDKLKESGMMWIFHPEFTGDYETDVLKRFKK